MHCWYVEYNVSGDRGKLTLFRFRCNSSQCSSRSFSSDNSGDATFCDSSRLFKLCWSHHCWLCLHCFMGRTPLWKEEYARIHINMQFHWRTIGCVPPGLRVSHCHTDSWYSPVQPLVHLCPFGFCHCHTGDRDHLSKCKFSVVCESLLNDRASKVLKQSLRISNLHLHHDRFQC